MEKSVKPLYKRDVFGRGRKNVLQILSKVNFEKGAKGTQVPSPMAGAGMGPEITPMSVDQAANPLMGLIRARTPNMTQPYPMPMPQPQGGQEMPMPQDMPQESEQAQGLGALAEMLKVMTRGR